MRCVRAVRAVLACAASAPLGAQSRGASPTIVIDHVTVVDVERGVLLPDRRVVVAGTRIVGVDSSARVAAPRGAARVIDGGGTYLIPGLWDMHVHAAWGSFGPGLPTMDSTYAPLFVANGVTGVRDMWGQAARVARWKAHVRERTAPWPRIVSPLHILDGPNPVWIGSVSVTTAEDARRAVDSLARAGADFIKAYSLLPRAAFLAAAAEATRLGLPIAGHVPNAVGVAAASDAGMRSIEHLTLIPAACSTLADSVQAAYGALPDSVPRATTMRLSQTFAPAILAHPDSARCDAVAHRLAANGTWLVPTLTVLRSTSHLDDTTFASDPRTRYAPPQYIRMWTPQPGTPSGAVTAEGWALRRRLFARQLDIVGQMARAGVPILAGTDFGNPFIYAGFSLHDELALLVRAGLTPAEALRAATLGPARYLDATDSLGTVAPGKLADLVLLDADPLADVRNTARIRAVIANGRYLDRAALDAMIARAERTVRESAAGPPMRRPRRPARRLARP
jgi:imidazolonepropionase-like amidohydrolase